MDIRRFAVVAFIAVVVGGFSATSQAGTFGASGHVSGVDLTNSTLQVGEYTLVVSGTSVLLDRLGRRISLAMLEEQDGEVSVSMYRVGSRYLVKTLQFYDPAQDD